MKMKNKTPATPEDSFFREVSEELKADNLQLIWKKYGAYIVLGVAAILTVTVSFESIKAWRMSKSEKTSNSYAIALALQNQGRYEESMKALEILKNENGGIYADAAEIQMANVLFEQGKTNEAVAKLEKISQNSDLNPKLKDMVISKLVSYKLDNAPFEEVAALLQPLIDENGAWTNIAKEWMAMLYVREGNFGKAREIYKDILNSKDIDQGLESRVKDMLATLDVEK